MGKSPLLPSFDEPTPMKYAPILFVLPLLAGLSAAAAPPRDTSRGDRIIADYFRAEAAAIAERSMADIKTAADWNARKDEYRRQLAERLGLWPMPPRTDLKTVITGKVDHPQFTVEKLYFQ